MELVAKVLAALTSRDTTATGELVRWWMAGVEAVEPRRLVQDALTKNSSEIARMTVEAGSVLVLAVGKAASAMAWGASDALSGRIESGLVITNTERANPDWADVMIGGHPVPNGASVEAADAAIRFVDGVAEDQLLLALVSGGGSALMEIPHPGLDLVDVQTVINQLIRSGAPIDTINGIRSHMSQVKGGRLAARCGGKVATLVLSDVLGSHPGRVASGPTVAPHGATKAVREDFMVFDIVGPEADRVLAFLSNVERDDGPAGTFPVEVVGDGRTAGETAVSVIAQSGASVSYVTDRLEGDAQEAACEALRRTPDGAVGVFTGETTVVVSGPGRGGRNQHAALAVALEISGTDFRFLACGTDGIDGPTDAAGAVVDGGTVGDAAIARRHLDARDAYPFLDRTGALIRMGSTGTNVGDLWIVDKRH